MNVAGKTFAVRVEGLERAPAVMLSHSLGAQLTMWDPQIAALCERFRVIRYDSRGHGGSVADPGPYSIAQLGRDALAIMDALAVTRAHWLGLSMGGMVGQWLLSHAPHRFDRAVLANTASHYPDPSGWNARITRVRSEGMAAIAAGVLERWFTPEFFRDHRQTTARVEADFVANPAEGYASCCAALRDMDLREDCRRISTPLLVIGGARDLATPPQLGRDIATKAQQARFHELNAGHLSNIEQSAAFTRLVVDFLSGG